MKLYVVSALALATVAACTDVDNSFNKETGSIIDGGNFGAATMNNHLTQTGANNLAVNLQRRFAAEVDTTVNFAFNSAVLDAEARSTLATQASWIKQFPEIRFKVFGHTDLVGSNAYNRRLGMRRARAVVNFLVSQGVSRSRLEAVVSLGETQPVVATQDMERRNRRTVTEVSGFVQNRRDDVLNGKYAEIIFREYVTSAVPQTTITDTTVTTSGE
ncbi:MAG: OmpA family protein [Pseudomonadota bacterium]